MGKTRGKRLALRTTLLVTICLTGSPVLAQDQDVEDRLDRLEASVEGLIERLDAQAGASQQQAAAMQAEQQAMRAQAEAALEATKALEAAQEEFSAKLVDYPIAPGDGFNVGKTKITYDGYVNFDAISQRTSGGQLPGNSILRDFLIPVAIPVGGEASGFDTDFSARQTRFMFKTETDVGTEHKLAGLIELDFNVTSGGNERISNSFVPRIRNALINYDNWTFGQGWSTFQNVGALPDTLDFIGVTPAMVFDRQPLIRYTHGGLQIALEQPETVVTSQAGARVIAGDDQIPDLVGRCNWAGDWGNFTAAGIVRQLHVSTDDLMGVDDAAWGYGLSLSGKIKVGEKDDFRFMTTAGDGMGCYFKADNPVRLTTDQVTDESWNTIVNLIWSPAGPINIGVELMYAERILEDGRSGNLQRVQFSTQYNF